VPINQMPLSFRSRIVRARLVTTMYGTDSAAPEATLIAAVVRPTLRSLGAITACAPAPSATRRQAPRLCGSCTPSSTRNNAGSSSDSRTSSMNFGISSTEACATTPWWRTPPAIPSSRFASTVITRTLRRSASLRSSFARASERSAST